MDGWVCQFRESQEKDMICSTFQNEQSQKNNTLYNINP